MGQFAHMQTYKKVTFYFQESVKILVYICFTFFEVNLLFQWKGGKCHCQALINTVF